MKVWIDQETCTGDGMCAEICKELFDVHTDGLAYVKEATWSNLAGPNGHAHEPALRGMDGRAGVPDDLVDEAIDAAEECPGECIFIEAG
jgi:ferredoxin